MLTLLVIIIVIALIVSLVNRSSFGYAPGGLIGLVLIFVLLWILLGNHRG